MQVSTCYQHWWNSATDLETRLAPRLKTAEPTLALQPTKLQDLIIPKFKELLLLSDTINQLIKTIKKFNKPTMDANSNPIKSREDPEKDLPYLSHCLHSPYLHSPCLHSPCPITASNAFKDNPDMKKLTEKAQDNLELYAKIKMTEHDKTIKEMEV